MVACCMAGRVASFAMCVCVCVCVCVHRNHVQLQHSQHDFVHAHTAPRWACNTHRTPCIRPAGMCVCSVLSGLKPVLAMDAFCLFE